MYAIIKTGGKQYKVAEGDVIRVELLDVEPENTVEIVEVLSVVDGETLTVGKPYIDNAKVSCKVLEHGKGKKIHILRYKPKKNIRVKKGHRQPFTKLQVEKITV
jgi:large subunit ribosomal protein L21